MILAEGETCWKRVPAERVAFVIDGKAFFEHLVTCFEKARRSIRILGWDIHSRVRLRRGDGVDEEAYRVGPFLDRLARRNRDLDIHILMWDFSMLYAAERELLQRFRLGWQSHRRIHFELDSNHPLGGCHHQKVIVVDDRVAFVGGFDLTVWRWDTPEHTPGHPLRKDPDGKPYPPFHDAQVAVSGPAARALGELFSERWQRATGRRLHPAPGDEEVWPDGLEPELTDVEVGIARTDPEHDGRGAVREIEALYLRALAAAQSYVILENQYAASSTLARALESVLRAGDGPEVLLIQPRRLGGWLEGATVGALRGKFIERMLAADEHGRLLCCYPHRDDLGDDWIKVHSKICIVDDSFVMVGSANLANRSMGLDTECNLAIEVDDPESRRALGRFRDRLLAEHLGVEPSEVGESLERGESLLETVHSLSSAARGLAALELPREEPLSVLDVVNDDELLDPAEPFETTELLDGLGGSEESGARRSGGWIQLAVAVVVAALLAAAWRYGPLADWLGGDRLAGWLDAYRRSPAALPLTVGLFLAGGVVCLPVTLLILQTAVVFEPGAAFAYSLAGSLASAAGLFGLGRLLGGRWTRRMGGDRIHRVIRFLADRGWLPIAASRLVPVAPFSLVNLSAGAVGIRWWPFLFGTAIGMAPGIAALTLVGDRIAAAVREPGLVTVLAAILLAVLVVVIGRWVAAKGAALATPADET